MSNFLAIATVTAALSQVLLEAVVPDVSGADVTTVHPDGERGTLPTTGVNIFLYQVTQNAAWHNADLPTRRGNGDLIQRPQAALDLHYLLTFYGDEKLLQPQRVLGSVVRTLHARPVLTRELIRRTIAKAEFSPFLVNSNLADAVELVKFTPLPLSLEELSKLWSVYFQTHYSLSIAYQGTVVLIESEDSTHAALPVRARNIYVTPFRQPLIEQIRSGTGAEEFIFGGSTVIVSGQRLRGDVTRVRVSDIEVTPAIAEVSDTEISLLLPADLRAGVQGLQVVQLMNMGTPPVPHRGVESNVAAFVLHPSINKKPDDTPEITVSGIVTDADGKRSANVTVKVSPTVAKKQRAVLLMSEIIPPLPPSDKAPRAYSFDSEPHNKPPDPEVTDTLVFPISRVKPADYFVRVQVDGADSPLEQSADEDNPLYIGPKVTI
jgi:uncharacterized protein DUF4255